MTQIQNLRRPFRADQVGSYLRPAELLDARAKKALGRISAAELKAVEDKCVDEVVVMQERLGLHCVTDGEFRRNSWNKDFLAGFNNVVEQAGNLQVFHLNEDGTQAAQISGWGIVGKISRKGPIQVDDFAYLKKVAKVTPKTCIPSPTLLHFRGGRDAIDRVAYPDIDAFFGDAAQAYAGEIADLYAAGARYIQLDDTNLAYLCDETFRRAARGMGEDPDKLVDRYIKLINDCLRGRPKDLLISIHLCRGNLSSGGAASGGYEMIGPKLFPQLDVDAFFLEYDDARAGSFSALADLPRDKHVVLGLVTTKRPDLESKSVLKGRIEEATKYVNLDQICISPQCGFSSVAGAEGRSQAPYQEAKVRLLVETAHEVWHEL